MARSREPLPLDLLNTVELDRGVLHDLLDSAEGLEWWLRQRGIEAANAEEQREPLRRAREAMRQVLSAPGDPKALRAMNAVLERGSLRPQLDSSGPRQVPVVRDGAWVLAWLAAHELTELLATKPDRIRSCEAHDCVLWFLDTTRSGTRRWCSMEGCGNRAKVRRHRARSARARRQ